MPQAAFHLVASVILPPLQPRPSQEPEGSSQNANWITSCKSYQDLPLLWDKEQCPPPVAWEPYVGWSLPCQSLWAHLEYFPFLSELQPLWLTSANAWK